MKKMNQIYIEHNPFIVESRFLINGAEPAEGCKLSSYKEARLQIWVESLFAELSLLLNGDKKFNVEFRGVESDYMDLLDAAEVARAQGMTLNITWLPVKETRERLTEIQTLMNYAHENPQFRDYIENNDRVKVDFDEAFNHDFNLYVIATMSSGKSTLINAMLGKVVLHAANEATTATIAQITDDKTLGESFVARRISTDSRVPVDERTVSADIKSLMKEWNDMADTQQIELRGNIIGMQARDNVRLVLTDTPGPNSSSNPEHERVTMSFIQDSRRNPLILYVINATQIGINDDKKLLGLMAQTMARGGKQSKDRFIFAVNKMDEFDPENGEDIGAALGRVKTYLQENGIPNPQVYPISARFTRMLRARQDDLTTKERNELNTLTELFLEEDSMDLPAYMPLTSRVRRALDARGLPRALYRSGLPAVEVMIDEYIDKYTFPNRLKRAYDALTHAIELGMREAELTEQLEQDERALAHINEQIQLLEKRRKAGAETEAYKERLRRKGKGMPEHIAKTFISQQAKVAATLKAVGEEMGNRQEESPALAKQYLDSAERNARFLFKELINDCENAFEESQKFIKDDLQNEYHQYIASLFEDTRQLKLPILDGLKGTLGDFALNLSLNERDIQSKQERYNERKVWDPGWNPLSWFTKRTVWDYRTVEYVNMKEIWDQKRIELSAAFTQLLTEARTKIEADKDKLVKSYVSFFEGEFENKFNELISSLKIQLTDKEARELAIAEGRAQKEWITHFKSQMDATLAIKD